jgi:hypothetical protein
MSVKTDDENSFDLLILTAAAAAQLLLAFSDDTLPSVDSAAAAAVAVAVVCIAPLTAITSPLCSKPASAQDRTRGRPAPRAPRPRFDHQCHGEHHRRLGPAATRCLQASTHASIIMRAHTVILALVMTLATTAADQHNVSNTTAADVLDATCRGTARGACDLRALVEALEQMMDEEDAPGFSQSNGTFLSRLVAKAHNTRANVSPLCRCRDLVLKMRRHKVDKVPVAGECIQPYELWFDTSDTCLAQNGTTEQRAIAMTLVDTTHPIAIAYMAASKFSFERAGTAECVQPNSELWRYHLDGGIKFLRFNKYGGECDDYRNVGPGSACTASDTPSSAYSGTMPGVSCATANQNMNLCRDMMFTGCEFVSQTGFDVWTGATVAAAPVPVQFNATGWCARPGSLLNNTMETRRRLFMSMPNATVSLMDNTIPRSLDPRPPQDSPAAYSGVVDRPFSTFFDSVHYSGAFSPSGGTWLDKWSYLDCVRGALSTSGCNPQDPAAINRQAVADPNVVPPTNFNQQSSHCGAVSTNQTWTCNAASCVHQMSCTVTVSAGVTLTIQPGVTVYASANTSLVVLRGGNLDARGTMRDPITFTTALTNAQMHVATNQQHVGKGFWGGIVILGSSGTAGTVVVRNGTAAPGNYTFGPTVGVASPAQLRMQYLRVWHGGQHDVPAIMFVGVHQGTNIGYGFGTDVHHLEVAHAGSAGIVAHGGNVNAKHLSTLFCEGPGLVLSGGYTGSIQFVFALASESYSATTVPNHGPCETIHLANINMGTFCGETGIVTVTSQAQGTSVFQFTGRTAPQVMGVTAMRAFSAAPVLGFYSGAAGHFGNMVLIRPLATIPAVQHTGCTSELTTQSRRVAESTNPSTVLYMSRNTITARVFFAASGCQTAREYWQGVQGDSQCSTVVEGRSGCAQACTGSSSCRGFTFVPEQYQAGICNIFVANSTASVWVNAKPLTHPPGVTGEKGCYAKVANCNSMPAACSTCSYSLCFGRGANSTFCSSPTASVMLSAPNAACPSNFANVCSGCDACTGYQGCLPDVAGTPATSELIPGWVAIDDTEICSIAHADQYEIKMVNFSAPDFTPKLVNKDWDCVQWALHEQPSQCNGTWATGNSASQPFSAGMRVLECTGVTPAGTNVTNCTLLMADQAASTCRAVCAGIPSSSAATAGCVAAGYQLPDWDPPQCTLYDNVAFPSFATLPVAPKGGTCATDLNGVGCCSSQPPGSVTHSATPHPHYESWPPVCLKPCVSRIQYLEVMPQGSVPYPARFVGASNRSMYHLRVISTAI